MDQSVLIVPFKSAGTACNACKYRMRVGHQGSGFFKVSF